MSIAYQAMLLSCPHALRIMFIYFIIINLYQRVLSHRCFLLIFINLSNNLNLLLINFQMFLPVPPNEDL